MGRLVKVQVNSMINKFVGNPKLLVGMSIQLRGRENKMINKLLENPELLVGMLIQHRVRENDVEATWHRANFVGIDKFNRSNLK